MFSGRLECINLVVIILTLNKYLYFNNYVYSVFYKVINKRKSVVINDFVFRNESNIISIIYNEDKLKKICKFVF